MLFLKDTLLATKRDVPSGACSQTHWRLLWVHQLSFGDCWFVLSDPPFRWGDGLLGPQTPVGALSPEPCNSNESGLILVFFKFGSYLKGNTVILVMQAGITASIAVSLWSIHIQRRDHYDPEGCIKSKAHNANMKALISLQARAKCGRVSTCRNRDFIYQL